MGAVDLIPPFHCMAPGKRKGKQKEKGKGNGKDLQRPSSLAGHLSANSKLQHIIEIIDQMPLER